MGWGLFDAKNFTEALEPLRKAVTLAPDYDYAYDLLAQSLRSLHRDEESLPIWERLVNLRPTDADAHAGLGWALQSVGRNREALAALKKAHELDSTLLLDYSFALSYAHLNEYREAIAARIGVISSRMPISFVSLPTVSSLEEYGQAIPPSLKALELNPALEEAWHNLGERTYRREIRRGGAALEKLLKLGDGVPESHLLLGLAYARLGFVSSPKAMRFAP